METDDARLQRMQKEWIDLDEAMIVNWQFMSDVGWWPWLSDNPQVMSAWEALTRPEHLADLVFRLAYHDDGATMNDWAATVTRKAIEISRSRALGHD